MAGRKRVLVTGSAGFVGKYLMMELAKRFSVFGLSREESCWVNFATDFTDPAALDAALASAKPDIIVHAGAWPDVEGCERDREECMRVNVGGTENVCRWASRNGAKVIFISTDYVYARNGTARNTEEAPTGFQDNYTESKLKGEALVLAMSGGAVVRTGFIYGLDPGGLNFLMQMLSGRELVVVEDQVVTPTCVRYVARAVSEIASRGLTGIYNCSGPDALKRIEFARMISAAFGEGRFVSKKTSEMKYLTKRPLSVIVDSSKAYSLFGPHPPTGDCLAELAKEHAANKVSVFRRTECRGCGSKDVEMIFSYGRMPVANSFQLTTDLNAIPLEVMFCNDCSLVQIWDVVSAENLFTDYRYLSSVSPALKAHFGGLADAVISKLGIGGTSRIYEIGSNDGIFQEQGKLRGLEVVGIEPAKNVVAMARANGFDVVNDFFNEAVARKLASERGAADLVVGCNVLAHIDDMRDVLAGVRTLLKDSGTLVFEVHYVVDLVRNREYDNMYHEHVNEYSLTAIKRMLERNGLFLRDVEHIPNHGGSLRVYACACDGQPSAAVDNILADEKAGEFDKKTTYVEFFGRIADAKRTLFERLNKIKCAGGRIAAYGASARGTIFLNYCNVGLNLVDYVVDKSCEKQGRFMPRNGIPILPPDALKDDRPTHILLAAYTYFAEIMREQVWFDGTWIIPLPEYSEKPYSH